MKKLYTHCQFLLNSFKGLYIPYLLSNNKPVIFISVYIITNHKGY